MNILIGCEESQEVCKAFRALGFNAFSCDLKPCSGGHPEWHIQCDVLEILGQQIKIVTQDGTEYWIDKWDVAIFHPPCTFITVSGNRWYAGTEQRKQGIAFAEMLWKANIERIALENPIGVLSTQSILGKPSQIIQPYMFGHGETKATCLWLKGLPLLIATKLVEGREGRVWKMPPSKDRAILRSKTYPGIAQAIAIQWSKYIMEVKAGCNADSHDDGIPPNTKELGILPTIL